ncbi:hypothetical protein [Heliophilum fasciatum]|uniref:YjcQ protein n=1 Tax=Heliophilum fasciatum TaxID=35700 RepID=A0A4R2RLD5_9FIRM|nr:hypothetical protein [Heliophilum fasciatum]MCW2277765.1 hypothetical protein [Heliophilum fasciatum]TCP64742.1 hypothetical protein EDD73_10895 [Heliophilum fasciatum]
MNQIEIRYAILEDLYDQAVASGRLKVNISEKLLDSFKAEGLADTSIIFNLRYLEDKGLLSVDWGMQQRIFGIKLTAEGCDIVEFSRLGSSVDSQDKETRFSEFMSRIVNSGINVLENSAVGLVNLALSKLLA